MQLEIELKCKTKKSWNEYYEIRIELNEFRKTVYSYFTLTYVLYNLSVCTFKLYYWWLNCLHNIKSAKKYFLSVIPQLGKKNTYFGN